MTRASFKADEANDELLSSIWRRLPPELSLAIAEMASETMLPGTLCRWCLVSQAWYRIAVSALYECIVLSPNDDDIEGAWRIQRFCETILENPALALTVKALDFAVSREESGIANQQQYLAILDSCRSLIYLRNLQRPRQREDTYLLSIPPGALSSLQWHDSDLRAFEELVECVYKPLHFRTNPDARGTVRTDVVAADAQSSSRMLYDLRLIAHLPEVRRLPTGFFRRLISRQLPQQKVMLAWCTKNYQNDRLGADIALGILKILARVLPEVELIELYVTDCDYHFLPCPPTFSRASSTHRPCLYPKAFWDYVSKELTDMAPLPFAVGLYHVLTPDLSYVADGPGLDTDSQYEGIRDTSYTKLAPDFAYTAQEDMLEDRSTSGHGWQEPRVMLPNTRFFVKSKLKGGYHSLPFARWKIDKPAWDVLINPPSQLFECTSDAQDQWDVEASLGNEPQSDRPGIKQMPKRGTLEWLRLVKRNIDHETHDLTL